MSPEPIASPPRWDVLVVGSINTDFMARADELPQAGQTVKGDDFRQGPGGKGANQAVAAARLGARVGLIGRVGSDDRGDELLARLAEEGVDTRHVAREREAPTGAALILINRRGEKQILMASGANRHLAVADVRAARADIVAARVVLAQLEVPLPAVEEAIRIGTEAGARAVLDPAPAVPLPDHLLRRLHVIRPNASEAEVLTGIPVRDRDSARAAAEALLAGGASAAAVEAGPEGNLLVWDGGERWLPKLDVESVDTTGAGDAFAAALAVALAEGRSLEEAGPLASAAAALATTKLGAQAGLPRREAVERLLAQTAGTAT